MLPFGVYAIVGRRLEFVGRGVVIMLVLTITTFKFATSSAAYVYEFLFVALAYSYVVAVNSGLAFITATLSACRFARAVAFAFVSLAYFLIPARLGPSAFRVAIIVLGWDAMLKGYSYASEKFRVDAPGSYTDLSFFMLVDPSLCFTERARRGTDVSPPIRSVGRIVLGVSAMVSGGTLRFVGAATHGTTIAASLGASRALLAGLLAFLWIYALHSGLASIQIGTMRLLGFAVAERYNYPLAANAPADFWRRWNVYVGHWFRKYVFNPIAIEAARRRGGVDLALTTAMAVLVTFTAVGIAHDTQTFAEVGAFSLRSTVIFLAVGAVLVLWEVMRKKLDAITTVSWPWAKVVVKVIARGTFVGVLAMVTQFFA